jgi:hypothetical protein
MRIGLSSEEGHTTCDGESGRVGHVRARRVLPSYHSAEAPPSQPVRGRGRGPPPSTLAGPSPRTRGVYNPLPPRARRDNPPLSLPFFSSSPTPLPGVISSLSRNLAGAGTGPGSGETPRQARDDSGDPESRDEGLARAKPRARRRGPCSSLPTASCRLRSRPKGDAPRAQCGPCVRLLASAAT